MSSFVTSFFTNLLGFNSPPSQELTADLYEATQPIHAQVEQHLFVKKLLHDTLEMASYQQYLVDIRLVYQALEDEIEANLQTQPELQKIKFPGLNRHPAIEADLNSDPFKNLPQNSSKAAREYAEHLRQLGQRAPILLAAHAYVRYLGDLSGGMILKKHVEKKWPEACHLYDFSAALADGKSLTTFKQLYKTQLNQITIPNSIRKDLTQEALLSFEYAKEMFDAIFESSEARSE